MTLATNKTGFDDMQDDDLGHVPSASELAAMPKNKKFEKRAPTDRAETLYSEPCSKCRGQGYIGAYAFREAGKCYQCDGKGVLTFKTPKAVRDANKIKSQARKEKKLADNLTAFEAANPVIRDWWTGSTFPFAVSLRENVQKFGDLTPGQLTAALRCAEKFSEAKSAKETQRAANEKAAPVVSISSVTASFERARQKGVQKPKMRLLGNGQKLTFSRAPDTGKNAGAVYVKDNEGVYLGKITAGKFLKSYDCSSDGEKAVVAACADPEQAAIAFGKEFGICSICSRTLTDPDSIERGIGPICADNFFG
jgi:hypothetical protein